MQKMSREENKMTVAILIQKTKEVVVMSNFEVWAKWFEKAGEKKRVGLDEIGDMKISTIFLGMDHGFDGPPIWFETVIFGGDRDGESFRYETWAQAEAGHKKLVEELSK